MTDRRKDQLTAQRIADDHLARANACRCPGDMWCTCGHRAVPVEPFAGTIDRRIERRLDRGEVNALLGESPLMDCRIAWALVGLGLAGLAWALGGAA